MKYIKLIPIYGLRNNCSIGNSAMYKGLDRIEGQPAATTFVIHDAGGINLDYNRVKGACSKAMGRVQWSAGATAQATKCLGLFELDDGTNVNHIYFDNGKCYIYDSSKYPRERHDYLAYDGQTGNFAVGLTVTGGTSGATGYVVADNDAGATGTLYLSNVTGVFQDNEALTDTGTGAAVVNGTLGTLAAFATDDVDLYSMINFGGYIVFTDRGEHTPYKWKHGDDTLTKLIQSGTEYKFRYIIELANRIIGVHSDQTNGDLEVRYTNVLPAWASLEFPAANQFYKSESYSQITGIGKIGSNTGYLFSKDDIIRLDYYSSQTPCFNTIRVMTNCGSVNHASIVSDGESLYFYDKRRGFVKYDGKDIKVISENIDSIISGITKGYHNLISGKYIPPTGEIVWAIPTAEATTPNYLVYYHIESETWRQENKSARCIDLWKIYSNLTWNDFVTLTGDIWPTDKAWLYYTSESDKIALGNSNGHTYLISSEGDAGSNLDGYRLDPILPICDGISVIRLLEIWIAFSNRQDIDLDFYWRSGDSVGEVLNSSWTSLGSINMDEPDNAVLYIDQTARLHQLKWGTDLKNEYFSIDNIKIGYTAQGKY